MSKRIPLTLACGDYEIVRAIKEGLVRVEGVDLTVIIENDAGVRHRRFFRNNEFDAAEASSSNFLVARDKGLPYCAIPVFLHRRFRHGFVFINTTKGINTPTDLIGKKIGVVKFQSSSNLWVRGILEQEYGVPHRSIEWFSEADESVEVIPSPELKLSRVPVGKSVDRMLAEGELDAVMDPDPIQPFVEKDPRVARLFPDYKTEEIKFFRKTGIFPIMHVTCIRREIVDRYPWIPTNLYRAFREAKSLAMARMANPRIAPLAWYQEAWEEQQEILGRDPWEYGLTAANKKQLEILIGHSHNQGMIKTRHSVEELFLPVMP